MKIYSYIKFQNKYLLEFLIIKGVINFFGNKKACGKTQALINI